MVAMTQPRQWEAALRELGQFLDNQDAHHIEIVDEPRCLAVSWQVGRETERQCSFLEVASEAAIPPDHDELTEWWSWEALLASLGHEIDRAQINVASIREGAGGIVVSGSSNGLYVCRHFRYLDLQRRRGQNTALLHYPDRPRWVGVAAHLRHLIEPGARWLARAS